MNNISKNIREMYEILEEDISFLSGFQLTKNSPQIQVLKTKDTGLFTNIAEDVLFKNKSINISDDETIKDGYELIAASFRKSVYKYFLNSLFPVIYNLKNKFTTTSEYLKYKGQFFESEQIWRRFLVYTLYTEKDMDIIMEKKQKK